MPIPTLSGYRLHRNASVVEKSEPVILVDRQDRALGTTTKVVAHRRGYLHRAFSVAVLNAAGDLLVQQRAYSKYHSGGRWGNSCCGHPRPGESLVAAAKRRLYEEMGIRCGLREEDQFRYRAWVAPGLVENEIDHLLVGSFNGPIRINRSEVAAFRWLSLERVRREAELNPLSYVPWFHEVVKRL